jgi:hypothetical protein
MKRHCIALAAGSIICFGKTAVATDANGLHSVGVVAGPDLGGHSTEFSLIGSSFVSPPEVHIQARTTTGSIDTSECPSNYGNLGTPVSTGGVTASDLSTPSVTSGGWAFVVAYVGSAGWQLFSSRHNSAFATCSGWSSWTQWVLPSGVSAWSSAPSAVTLADGRTIVFVYAPDNRLYYRITQFNSFFHAWEYSDWYFHGYWTYPFVNASTLGAPTVTLSNGQIVVNLHSNVYGIVWDKTTSLGSGLNDLTWYSNDDCGTGGGGGYRYDSLSANSVVGVTAVGDSASSSDLWFGYVDTSGILRVHRPNWTAGCSGSYPSWTAISTGSWDVSTARPSLGFAGGWGNTTNFMLVQWNAQWFGGVLLGGVFASNYVYSTNTWPSAVDYF